MVILFWLFGVTASDNSACCCLQHGDCLDVGRPQEQRAWADFLQALPALQQAKRIRQGLQVRFDLTHADSYGHTAALHHAILDELFNRDLPMIYALVVGGACVAETAAAAALLAGLLAAGAAATAAAAAAAARAGKRSALKEHMQTKDHKELVEALEAGAFGPHFTASLWLHCSIWRSLVKQLCLS
jgi:hypothetical protein